MSVDPSLLIGTLELDAQIERQIKANDFNSNNTRSPLEMAAFEAGYQAASAVLIEASRRFWSAGSMKFSKGLQYELEQAETRSDHRMIPKGWSIRDTHAGHLFELIEKSSKKSERPTLIFDLDGTLVNVSYRTLGIFKKWLANLAPDQYPPDLFIKLSSINLVHIGYSLAHAFENAGLDLREEDVADAFQSAEAHWRKHFFDGESLVEFDRKISGASEFVHKMRSLGIQIVYLTGRSAHTMKQGTKKQLELLGFPVENCRLFMKENCKESDHIFKENTVRVLSQTDKVIANFENEYINLHSMMAFLPQDCLHILVDSQHSGRPVPPNPVPIFRIRDYEAQ